MNAVSGIFTGSLMHTRLSQGSFSWLQTAEVSSFLEKNLKELYNDWKRENQAMRWYGKCGL